MAIYDNDGTASYEIGKLYDNDGITDYQIGKVYDNDGTADSLIYTSEFELFNRQYGARVSFTYDSEARAWCSRQGSAGSYYIYQASDYVYDTNGTARTTNKIDVSNYSKIRCKGKIISSSANGSAEAALGLASNGGNTWDIITTAIVWANGIGDFDLTSDISNVSGKYYVAVAATCGHCQFYEIWLE